MAVIPRGRSAVGKLRWGHDSSKLEGVGRRIGLFREPKGLSNYWLFLGGSCSFPPKP